MQAASSMWQAKCLANQMARHVVSGQVSPLDIGRMLAQQGWHEGIITIDKARFDTNHPPVFALLDHLHIYCQPG